MTTALLELRGVEKSFGGLRAVRDVNLSVSKGEIVGIMGANGAGKTTLFALIAGHLQPNAGEILLDGKSIVGLPPHKICRRGIARTFQIVRPFAGLSVLENVVVSARFGATWSGKASATSAATKVLEAVGLGPRLYDRAGSLTLSGQKKLEVARAIATGAHIVLLDEVMAGLTPPEVSEMLEIISWLRFQYDLTILVIEHVMRALMRISDRVLVLHHGETIAIGTPQVISNDQKVLDCYLGTAA